MKRLIAVAVAAVMLATTATACGNADDNSAPSSTSQSVTPAALDSTAEAEPMGADELFSRALSVYADRSASIDTATRNTDSASTVPLPARVLSSFSLINNSSLNFPAINMAVTTEVLPNGNFHSVADLHQPVASNNVSASLNTVPVETIFVDERYFANRSDIKAKYNTDLSSEWIGTSLADKVNLAASIDLLLKVTSGRATVNEVLTTFRNVAGSKDFMRIILEDSTPIDIGSTEILRGYTVNRLQLEVPLVNLMYAFLGEYNLFYRSIESSGIVLPPLSNVVSYVIGSISVGNQTTTIDFWVDQQGVIHRILLDGSSQFLPLLQAAFPDIDLDAEDIQAMVQTDIWFYDNINQSDTSPNIEAPLAELTNFIADPAGFLDTVGIQYVLP